MVEFYHGDLKKYVFSVTEFKGRQYINLRLWQRYDLRDEKDWKPTKRGLFIPFKLVEDFKKAITQFLNELKKEVIKNEPQEQFQSSPSTTRVKTQATQKQLRKGQDKSQVHQN